MISRRVIGLETEYGLTCASIEGGAPPLDAEAAAGHLFRPIVEANRSTNTFLDNGARLYLDVGSHPEYATAECDTIDDVIAQDRAGDLIYADFVEQANAALVEHNIAGRIHLFKNNIDAEGNPFGCHENYLVRRQPTYRAQIQSMLPFFISRQIMCGAGYIHVDEDGKGHYEFSQRARHMDDAISAASTNTRPMINTRDEPHSDAEKYRRMHVTVGDSTMAQASTGLKVATTEAILTMFEAGGALPELTVRNPIQAIRTISSDLTGQAAVELANGTEMSGLDIQRRVRDSVLDFLDSAGILADFDERRHYFMDLWTRALEAVETGDWDSIATDLDWVIKYRLLERYRQRLGVDLSDIRCARLDLAYHDITSAGLRASMEKTGLMSTVITPQQANEAKNTPPQTTRAKMRGDFVRAARQANREYGVDWMNLRLLGPDGARSVILDDPLQAYNEQAQALIEEMSS
ncbi:MAG: Pup--protein ligase [Actinomycetaceae bacterium]|nr:Pup--protein ligase [Actinomycetaceae bacterium]